MKTRPLRLLHLTHSLRPESGGTASAVLQAARSQLALGHTVEVVSVQQNQTAPPEDIPTHCVGEIAGGYGYNRVLGPWLESRVQEFDLLVVHGLWQYPGRAAWHHWHRKGKGRYLVFPHGMLDPWFNRAHRLKQLKKQPYWWAVERRVLRDAAAVCFTCNEERRLARTSFGGYRAKEEVVGLGIAETTTPRDQAENAFHQAYPQLQSSPFILFLGRIHPKKGLENTLHAYAQAYHNGDPQHMASLVIVGPAENATYAEALRQKAAALGIAQVDLAASRQGVPSPVFPPPPRIVWLPMIDGAIKQGALHCSEALVLCSHQENFGLVVAEATATGRPVLIGHGVNIWREIITAKAGLASPDTPEATADLLARWRATSEAERLDMGRRARTCYLEHFSADQATQRFLAIAQRELKN